MKCFLSLDKDSEMLCITVVCPHLNNWRCSHLCREAGTATLSTCLTRVSRCTLVPSVPDSFLIKSALLVSVFILMSNDNIWNFYPYEFSFTLHVFLTLQSKIPRSSCLWWCWRRFGVKQSVTSVAWRRTTAGFSKDRGLLCESHHWPGFFVLVFCTGVFFWGGGEEVSNTRHNTYKFKKTD